MAGNALKLQAVSNQMLLLVLAMSELFSASSGARSDSGGGRKIEVGINTLLRDGSYTISIDEVLWLRSAPTKVHVNNNWYSSNPGQEEKKLNLTTSTGTTGTDEHGKWQSFSAHWMADNVPFITTSKVYTSTTGLTPNLIIFEQLYPLGANGTSIGDHDAPSSSYPSFLTNDGEGMFGKLGYLSIHGGMSSGLKYGKYSPSFGGSETSQIALMDSSLRVVMLSPLDGFLTHVMNGKDDALNMGLGGMYEGIWPNYTVRSLLYADYGVRDTFMRWGDVLLRWNGGKQRTSVVNDIFISHLGYSTTGMYFYNPCDGKTLKNCSNYEDTILQFDAYRRKADLPFSYYLLDSWWYGEDIYGGVSLWEDTPTLLKDRFPHGLKYLAQKVGLPFKCHHGKWSKTTPYVKNFTFYNDTHGNVIPYGPDVWDYLFGANNEWGMQCIKQDHISEQVQMTPFYSDPTVPEAWLMGQSGAASRNNVYISYCMEFPYITLNSVRVGMATHQRVGNDYLPRLNEHNWIIGASSMFAYSLGLLPYKDTFFSSSEETAKSGKKFNGFHETAPRLHAVVSILSAGPVAPSDAVGGVDIDLIMSLCRRDGLLLKPDVPAMPVDSTWKYRVFGDKSAPDGELWHTYSVLNVIVASDVHNHTAIPSTLTWQYFFAAGMTADHNISTSKMSQCMAYSTNVSTPGQTLPVVLHKACTPAVRINATGTAYGDFRVTYTAQMMPGGWALLGELDKLVPMSAQRVHKIVAGVGMASITVAGVYGERVSLSFVKYAATTVSVLSCTIGVHNTTTLLLPSGVCEH